MDSKLKNKVILITGASAGLGRAISINCFNHGMKVVLIDKSIPSYLKKIGTKKKDFLFFKIDVTLSKEIKKVVAKVMSKFGKIDFLINNVGIGGNLAFIDDYSEREWDKLIDTNLKSVFLFCKECAKGMIENKSGHIINISSILGKNGFPYFSIYSASKGGIIAFSKSLREELKQFNIKIDVICPGSINTPFIDKVRIKGRLKESFKPKKVNRNEMLNVKEVSDVILNIMEYPDEILLDDLVILPKNFYP